MSDKQSFMQRHYFLLRRLHSISGVIPIGIFLIMHLTTNSSVVWGAMLTDMTGAETFQHEVNFIHSLPGLVLLEIFGLWLPIFFHAGFGFYIAFTGKSNVGTYKYGGNWRYTLQRVSGYIGFVFIVYHIATLRWKIPLPFSEAFDPKAAASSTAIALRGGDTGDILGAIVVGIIYLSGVTMLVYHFANGLWTWAITWGLTISESAMKKWGYICFALGAALMVAGWTAYIGFVTLDIEEAQRIEQRMLKGDRTEPELESIPAASTNSQARQEG